MSDLSADGLIDAGTAIVLRDSSQGLQVLLVHKGAGPQFHAGSWVFPGGKVDPADRTGPAAHDRALAAANAAVRETHEEAGVTLEPASLVPFAHWTTPEGAPRRFATWFFLATTVEGTDHLPTFDGAEIQDAAWLSPRRALDRHHAGEIGLPIPQYVSLLGLEASDSVDQAMAAARAVAPIEFLGHLLEDDEGHLVFVYEPDAAFGGGALDQPGPRHRLTMVDREMRYERS